MGRGAGEPVGFHIASFANPNVYEGFVIWLMQAKCLLRVDLWAANPTSDDGGVRSEAEVCPSFIYLGALRGL